MAALKIFWTQTARRQRNLIFEYWNERNQSFEYSKRLYAKINERTELLKHSPEIGKPTIFKNNRAISLGHYSIFYEVHLSRLIITAFWDNRQNPGKLTKLLKE